MKPLLLLLCIHTICTAQKTFIKYVNPKNKLTDSFKIQLKYYDELLYVTYENTNTFSTYSFDGQCNAIYKKNSKNIFTIATSKPYIDRVYPVSRIKYKDGYFFMNNKNEIKIVTPKITKTFDASHTKQYLGKGFNIASYNPSQFLVIDSFVFSTFYYESIPTYKEFYKEKFLSKYILSKDNIKHIKDIFPNPINLYNFQIPQLIYTTNTKKIFSMYNCFDTIYIYDIQKDIVEKKIKINNKDYIQPEKWDYQKWLNHEPDFNSYDTKYTLQNFKYQAIYYNPLTNHFLLYYVTHTKTNDQNLKLLVLDENFNQCAYYEFLDKYFFSHSFFIIPNKGIAMPLLIKEDKIHEKPITYHIYNF